MDICSQDTAPKIINAFYGQDWRLDAQRKYDRFATF